MTDESDKKTITKTFAHPMEDIFDIEEGTTAITVPQPRNTQMVQAPTYDNKDTEIEENFQEVFDKAMDCFDDLQGGMDGIEGKYKARNTEVSIMMLTTALNAAKEKARLKEHKDNVRIKSGSNVTNLPPGSTVNNTLINVSTSDLIRQMALQKSPVSNQIEDDVFSQDVEVVSPPPTEPVNPPKRKMQPKKPPSGTV